MSRARPSRLAVFHSSPKSLRVLRRIAVPLLVVHFTPAAISGYRAIVQVYRVDIAMAQWTFGRFALSERVDVQSVSKGQSH
jgi:hypothetical protein